MDEASYRDGCQRLRVLGDILGGAEVSAVNRKLATRLFILAVVVGALAWTGWMQATDPDATISQVLFDMCTKNGPKGLAIPFLVGFVCGHFFFSGSYESSKKLE